MCEVYEVLLANQTPLTATQVSCILGAPVPSVSKTLWHLLYLGKAKRIVKHRKVFWKKA